MRTPHPTTHTVTGKQAQATPTPRQKHKMRGGSHLVGPEITNFVVRNNDETYKQYLCITYPNEWKSQWLISL